jgi:FMN-dependent NADH-azoreductase
MINTILRIDSSLRSEGSISRAIGDEIVNRLLARHPQANVERLDLGGGMTHIDAAWTEANFTPADRRTAQQRELLESSDQAVAQLNRADAVVLTSPIYNFSVPSSLRAWIDHVCRAGLTFRYTAEGPQGLLGDRPVYLAMASGGVAFGSPVDFASTYLRQVFRFIGIDDLRLVGAERTSSDAQGAQQAALQQLERWLPEETGRAA